jgi:hypothetical protein
MKNVLLCAVLALAAAFPAGAEEVPGRVDGVYYEAARGVFVPARGDEARGRRWADVDVGGRKVLARVPDEMRVAPGDLISVRLGEPKSSQLATVLPTTTVTRALGADPNASIGR